MNIRHVIFASPRPSGIVSHRYTAAAMQFQIQCRRPPQTSPPHPLTSITLRDEAEALHVGAAPLHLALATTPRASKVPAPTNPSTLLVTRRQQGTQTSPETSLRPPEARPLSPPTLANRKSRLVHPSRLQEGNGSVQSCTAGNGQQPQAHARQFPVDQTAPRPLRRGQIGSPCETVRLPP